ncbi:MAG TPA: adenylate/guanylate cyclase domain-containing protein [Ferruginibacter sp.]|nr:adenylate/guanylate cyclase domain-containing protein [Ferruginibacter sp.]
MSSQFDYTTTARRFTTKYPILSYVLTQINFWIIANLLLISIIHLLLLSVRQNINLPGQTTILPNAIMAVTIAILYGASLGLIDVFFEKQFFRKKPLGKLLLIKALISFIVFGVLFALIRYVIYDLAINAVIYDNHYPLSDGTWRYMFYLLLLYTFFMNLVISYINQVNKKFGPGVLLPLLLGKYRNPKEEERIFMFMDLTSSTMIAEKLGHFKYSSFIRDCFADINLVIPRYNGQIYQYVGDEIVLSWPVEKKITTLSGVDFFYACENRFQQREQYYLENYGMLPRFKAGLHMGKITVIEIGEIKKDLAYHGDTLNTAARIQGICNQYQKNLLVSKLVLDHHEAEHKYITESLGSVLLKGKERVVELVSIEGVR